MNGSQENCQSEVGSGGVLSVPEEFCQIGGGGGVEPVMRRVQRSLSGGGSVEWSGGGEAPGAERNRSTSRKAERTFPHGGADKLDGGPDKWIQNRTEGGQIERITRSLRSGGFWILLERFSLGAADFLEIPAKINLNQFRILLARFFSWKKDQKAANSEGSEGSGLVGILKFHV